MIYKIAICDDEKIICRTIYDMIKVISVQNDVRFETDCFISGEELCDEMKSSTYDLIFLDIELHEMNGVAVGKYIREKLNNETVQIAYISSKQQYAMELFEIRPINFLIKPITSEKIQAIIDKLLKLNAVDTQIFKFKVRQEYIKLPMSEIIYFSSSRRTVTLVSLEKSYTFYDTLEDIYSEVKNGHFLYIHKSFIVNYRYVRQYEYEQVTLLDGTVLPISQPRRKLIRKMILEMED
ncbi:MAG: response regulator transcription factor [Clostridia bacterium]|nr:response regulator transcription factor [Clostridia bacterium]MBR2175669.1 response regulator transcription factor [Clostridia bacterium]